MKNLLLTSLLIVDVGLTTIATNNKTENADKKATATTTTVTTTFTSDNVSEEPLHFNSKNSNYFNVIKNLEANSFVKLIQLNDYEAVKNLMIAGENIDRKSVGLTPLMHAAEKDDLDLVKFLISKKANIHLKNERESSAKDIAPNPSQTKNYLKSIV